MPKSLRPYPSEFRQRIIDLVREGPDGAGTWRAKFQPKNGRSETTLGHGTRRPACWARDAQRGDPERRPGSRGRRLHADVSNPKKMVQGWLPRLIVVTPSGDRV